MVCLWKQPKVVRSADMLKNSKWRSRVIVDSALCYIERLWFYTTYTRVCQRNLKPRPNDRNMPTQHIATLLGATCCVRLATLLRCVAICWVLLAQIWPVSNLSQQQPTCCNTSQHGGQKHATCCAQQCCDMLRWLVAIVWPGPYTKKLKTTFEQLHSGFWGNFWATFRVLEQLFEKIGEALVLTKRGAVPGEENASSHNPNMEDNDFLMTPKIDKGYKFPICCV